MNASGAQGVQALAVRWRPSPNVIAQRMRDTIMLLHLQTNRFYELNRTGARLWELLAAGHDRDQIKAQLLLEFSVDTTRLDQEIDNILNMLREEGLVSNDE